MKKHLLLVFVLSAVAVGHLPAQGSNVTFDKNANFANYKTYKWVTINGPQQLDELTADQLLGTLDVQLGKKGLTKSDAADLLLGYQIARSKDKLLSSSHASYEGGTGGSAGSVNSSATIVHSGQLVLDMYDGSTHQLIWRAVVSNAFDEDAKPEKKQKLLDKAVEKLLKDYPPARKP